MRTRLACLVLLAGCWATAAQAGDFLYKNGPINGICDIEMCTVDAWTINFGYQVTDSFMVNSASTIQNFNFAFWMFPGDTLTSVEWAVGKCEFCSDIAEGTASGTNLTSSFMSTNQYGYNIWDVGITGLHIPVSGGTITYWLTLQNAVVNSGDPVYWDENGGPSIAWTNCIHDDMGCIKSESFNITGISGTGATPEPCSIVLFGTALAGMAIGLRRRR
jgi:hypothetical protein